MCIISSDSKEEFWKLDSVICKKKCSCTTKDLHRYSGRTMQTTPCTYMKMSCLTWHATLSLWLPSYSFEINCSHFRVIGTKLKYLLCFSQAIKISICLCLPYVGFNTWKICILTIKDQYNIMTQSQGKSFTPVILCVSIVQKTMLLKMLGNSTWVILNISLEVHSSLKRNVSKVKKEG